MSGLKINPRHFMRLWTVAFDRFNCSVISRVVIRRFSSTNEFILSTSASRGLSGRKDWNYRNEILKTDFGIDVRSIHLLRTYPIVFDLLELHFCPFDSKTVKYAENVVFHLPSSIGHQMRTISQNPTKFFTNKLYYISCWNV